MVSGQSFKNPSAERVATEAKGLARRALKRFGTAGDSSNSVLREISDVGPSPKRVAFLRMIKDVQRELGDSHVLTIQEAGERGRAHFAKFYYRAGLVKLTNVVVAARTGEVLESEQDATPSLTVDSIQVLTGRSERFLAHTTGDLLISCHALGRYAERNGWRATEDDAFTSAVKNLLPTLIDKASKFNDLVIRLSRDNLAEKVQVTVLDRQGGAWLGNAKATESWTESSRRGSLRWPNFVGEQRCVRPTFGGCHFATYVRESDLAIIEHQRAKEAEDAFKRGAPDDQLLSILRPTKERRDDRLGNELLAKAIARASEKKGGPHLPPN